MKALLNRIRHSELLPQAVGVILGTTMGVLLGAFITDRAEQGQIVLEAVEVISDDAKLSE